MVDIDEIRNRAQQAKERAAASMKKAIEKGEDLLRGIEISSDEKEDPASAF